MQRFFLIFLLLLTGCGATVTAQPDDLCDRPINVLATTGMVADLVRQVGGARVEVHGLMGPGIDPHLYKPTAGDVRRLANADIIFYNGLHLEGRMGELFEKLNANGIPAIPISRDLDQTMLHRPAAFEGKFDPHIWFDVALWQQTTRTVAEALAALDPTSADLYQRNARQYRNTLTALDAYATAQIVSIPAERRVLITAHDAFGYFGSRYGIEVRGLQGISTTAEAGAADVRALAELLATRQIKAVFIESSVPASTVNAVREATLARGWNIKIGGELFSDALGTAGTPEGTYVGMVRHNVDTIVTALR